ncbi:MAG: hypothetical protein ABI024_07150 [Vicinamibacterales bacterium]
MIALDRRLDQARGVAGRPFQLILAEADGNRQLREPVSPKLIWLCMSGGGSEVGPTGRGAADMFLDGGPNQTPQLVVVHSTKSN